jgi:uncharacterized protein YcgL (UPF0745 family)
MSAGYITITSVPKSKEHKFGKVTAAIDLNSWMERKPLAATKEEIEEIMNAIPNISENLFAHAEEEDLIKAFNEFVNGYQATGEENEDEDAPEEDDKPATEKVTKKKVAHVEESSEIDDSLDIGDIEEQFKNLLND